MSKKPDTPYPTSHAIEDMFNDSAKDHAAVVNALDDNVDGEVMGYEHHFAGKHKGKESIVNVLMADFSTMVNSDTVTYEVVNVIGGGDSPWAAVEGIATAKSKTGKKFVHAHVYVLRFNGQGKIVKIRAYYDTHHIHNHAVEQGKASS